MLYCCIKVRKCSLISVVLCSPRFSRRGKSQEQETLKQGIPAPDAPMAGPEKLPLALQKRPSLYSGSLAEPHLFTLPPNTAGEAKLTGRRQPQAISQDPPLLQALPVIALAPPISLPFILPSVQHPSVPGTSQVMAAPGTSQMLFSLPLQSATLPSTQTSSPAVPYTIQQYRKRKKERTRSGTFTKIKYMKNTDVVLCKKCQKERMPPSHLQYFGNWYCEQSETQSHDEWRAKLEKQGYGGKRARKWQPSGFLKF